MLLFVVINQKKLGDKDLQSELKDRFVKTMYKKSLENEYYDSLEKLMTLPENFTRLISPVNDAGLKDLADRLNNLRGIDAFIQVACPRISTDNQFDKPVLSTPQANALLKVLRKENIDEYLEIPHWL